MSAEPRTVVLFAGGGTGGHLYPALALAEALVELRPDVHPVFVGASRGLEARVLPERGLEHLLLPVRGFARGVPFWQNLGVLPALVTSMARLRSWVRPRGPKAVVVTGGYAGAPAGLWAAMSGLPLTLQEQNAVPGATTKLLARWAARIHVAYPEVERYLPEAARDRIRVSGNPIRPPVERDVAQARAALGLEGDRLTVLVVGGSQGSVALNDATLAALAEIDADPGYQILWSTGPKNHEAVRAAVAEIGAPAWLHAVPYIDDMPTALAASDVAISRAGAMATSELLAWGVPAILVPLPTSAAGHQEKNARALAEAGCAIHAPQADLDGARLERELRDLLGDADRRARMRSAARERAFPNAARDIAVEIAEGLPAPRRAA